MIVSNVSNTKNKLSELLQKVQQGEVVTIVDRDKPVARLVPIPMDDPAVQLQRLISDGKIRVPKDFGKPWNVEPVLPVCGEYVGALEALLAEREEGH